MRGGRSFSVEAATVRLYIYVDLSTWNSAAGCGLLCRMRSSFCAPGALNVGITERSSFAAEFPAPRFPWRFRSRAPHPSPRL